MIWQCQCGLTVEADDPDQVHRTASLHLIHEHERSIDPELYVFADLRFCWPQPIAMFVLERLVDDYFEAFTHDSWFHQDHLDVSPERVRPSVVRTIHDWLVAHVGQPITVLTHDQWHAARAEAARTGVPATLSREGWKALRKRTVP